MKIADLKASGRRIEKGAWVGELPNLPGVEVKVRGAFNSDYNALFAKLAAEYTAEQLKDEAIQTEIDNRLMAETIIEDWRGIDDFPATPENKLAALTDPDLILLKRGINYAANNVATRGREADQDAEKNSPPSSDGSSPGASAPTSTDA